MITDSRLISPSVRSVRSVITSYHHYHGVVNLINRSRTETRLCLYIRNCYNRRGQLSEHALSLLQFKPQIKLINLSWFYSWKALIVLSIIYVFLRIAYMVYIVLMFGCPVSYGLWPWRTCVTFSFMVSLLVYCYFVITITWMNKQ